MPKFQYKAINTNGEIIEGEMEASEKQVVINQLHNKGHIPLEAEKLIGKVKSDFRLLWLTNKNKIQNKDILILTQELATLLHAGLPLDHALLTLENLVQPEQVKKIVQDIHSKVQGGATLASAMQNWDTVFNPLYLNMIRAGEASGSLEIIFERLSEYLERSAELKNTIISAIIYPAILFFIALVSIFALLFFVVPQFAPLFEDAGQSLPLPTQIVFGIAELTKQYWWLLSGCLALALWSMDKQLKDADKRLQWDKRFIKLPVLGDLLIKLEVTRFARTMGTLLINGVPLLTSIKIVRKVLSNQAISMEMDEISNSLEEGRGLAKPLSESGKFPSLVIELIQVGEETGQLEDMLIKIADIYDAESRTQIKRLLTLIEPILIIGLGTLIAMIIVSILLAVLGLNELVI